MTAEFQFAHFYLVHHNGEYLLCFYKEREDELIPVDYDLKSEAEKREIRTMLPRRAKLLVTLTQEAAFEILVSGLSVVLDMTDAEVEGIQKKMIRRWVQSQAQNEPESIAA